MNVSSIDPGFIISGAAILFSFLLKTSDFVKEWINSDRRGKELLIIRLVVEVFYINSFVILLLIPIYPENNKAFICLLCFSLVLIFLIIKTSLGKIREG